jgi:GxxExxY protein
MKPNEVTHEIIGAAIEVHRELGPGKAEAAYEAALSTELSLRNIPHKAQKPLPIVYKGIKLDCGYRLDALVADAVVVEAKAVDSVHPVHRAQTLTYLKLGGWRWALLLNFNVVVLKDGIERIVLGFGCGNGPGKTDRSQKISNGYVCETSFSVFNTCDRQTELLVGEVMAAAMEVHSHLGPGLLASSYEACLCQELRLRGIPFDRKCALPLIYKGNALGVTDEVTLLVAERIIVKPLAILETKPVHEAEVLSQLRLGKWEIGLLLNFNNIVLKDGIKRIVLSRFRCKKTN